MRKLRHPQVPYTGTQSAQQREQVLHEASLESDMKHVEALRGRVISDVEPLYTARSVYHRTMPSFATHVQDTFERLGMQFTGYLLASTINRTGDQRHRLPLRRRHHTRSVAQWPSACSKRPGSSSVLSGCPSQETMVIGE